MTAFVIRVDATASVRVVRESRQAFARAACGEKRLFDDCILYSRALHHMERSMPRPWRASVKCLSKTFTFLLVICKYVTFALVFSDINNRVTVVRVKATESPPQPTVCDMTGLTIAPPCYPLLNHCIGNSCSTLYCEFRFTWR